MPPPFSSQSARNFTNWISSRIAGGSEAIRLHMEKQSRDYQLLEAARREPNLQKKRALLDTTSAPSWVNTTRPVSFWQGMQGPVQAAQALPEAETGYSLKRNLALAGSQMTSPADLSLVMLTRRFGLPLAGVLRGAVTQAARNVPVIGPALQYAPRGLAAAVRPFASGNVGTAYELGVGTGAVYGAQEVDRRLDPSVTGWQRSAAQLAGGLAVGTGTFGAAKAGLAGARVVPKAKNTATLLHDTKKAMEVWDETYNNSAWKDQSGTTQRYKDAYGILREAERQAKAEGYRGPVIDTSQVDSWKRPSQEGATLEPDIAIPRGAESTGRWAGDPRGEQLARVAGGVDGDPPVPRESGKGFTFRMIEEKPPVQADLQGKTTEQVIDDILEQTKGEKSPGDAADQVIYGNDKLRMNLELANRKDLVVTDLNSGNVLKIRADKVEGKRADGTPLFLRNMNADSWAIGVRLNVAYDPSMQAITRGGPRPAPSNVYRISIKHDNVANADAPPLTRSRIMELSAQLFEAIPDADAFESISPGRGLQNLTVGNTQINATRQRITRSDVERYGERIRTEEETRTTDVELRGETPEPPELSVLPPESTEELLRVYVKAVNDAPLVDQGDRFDYNDELKILRRNLEERGVDEEQIFQALKASQVRPFRTGDEVETTAVEIEEDNNILSPTKQGLEVSEAADVQERGTISSAEDPEVTTTGLDERNRIVEPVRYKEHLESDEKAFFTRSVNSLTEIAKEQGHTFEQDLREGLPQFTREALTDIELAEYLNATKMIDEKTGKTNLYEGLDLALATYIDDLDVSLDPAHPRKGVDKVEEAHIAHLREMALQEAKAAYLAGGRSLEAYARDNPYASHTLLNAASHFAREQAATTKLLDFERTGDPGPNPFNPDNAPERFNRKFETIGLVDAFAEELDDIYGFGIAGRTAGDIILQDFSGSKNAGLGRLRALADEWDEKYKHLSPEFYSRETMMPLFEALDPNTYKSVTRASDSLEGFPLLQQMYHDIRLLLDNHEVEFLKFLEQMSGDEDVIRRKLNAANIAQSFMGSPNYFPRNWIREGQKLNMWDAPMTPQETQRWLQSRNDMTFREMIEKRKVEPVSWNPVDMAFRRVQEGQEFMLNYLLLKHARRLEIAVDAGDINWFPHVGEGGPLRTPKLSGPAARIWKGTPIIKENAKGELEYEVDEDGLVKTTGTMAVPNSFADTLESIFNIPGISKTSKKGKAFHHYDRFADNVKRINLTGSLFQHSDMMRRAIGASLAPEALIHTRGMSALTLPSFVGEAFNVSFRPSKRKQLRRDILFGEDPLRTTKLGITWPMLVEHGDLGIVGDTTIFNRNIREFIQAEEKWMYSNTGKIAKPFLQFRRYVEAGLFDGMYTVANKRVVEQLLLPIAERRFFRKLNKAEEKLKEQFDKGEVDAADFERKLGLLEDMRKPGGPGAIKVARIVAEQANVITSQIQPWQASIRNKRNRAIMRRTLFSMNENEALLKQAWRALLPAYPHMYPPDPKGFTASAAVKGQERKFNIQFNENYRSFVNLWGGYVISFTLVANVFNYISTFIDSEGDFISKANDEGLYYTSGGKLGKRHGRLMHENPYPVRFGGQLAPYKPLVKKKGAEGTPLNPFTGYERNRYFLAPYLPGIKGPSGEPLYMDMLGQMDTPMRWGFSAKAALLSRLDIPLTAGSRAVEGTTFMSGKTSGALERIGGLAWDLFTPIPVKLGGDFFRGNIPALSRVIPPAYGETLGEKASIYRVITGEGVLAPTREEWEMWDFESGDASRRPKVFSKDELNRIPKERLKEDIRQAVRSGDWMYISKIEMQQGYQLFEGDRRVQTRMIDFIFKKRRDWNRIQRTGSITQKSKRQSRWATPEMLRWAIKVSGREAPAEETLESYKESIEVGEPTGVFKDIADKIIEEATVPGPVPAVK